jgi:hypothetical protein
LTPAANMADEWSEWLWTKMARFFAGEMATRFHH